MASERDRTDGFSTATRRNIETMAQFMSSRRDGGGGGGGFHVALAARFNEKYIWENVSVSSLASSRRGAIERPSERALHEARARARLYETGGGGGMPV